MEKEFVSYEQAVALKELGFNEICMGYFDVRLEHQIGNFDFREIKEGYHKSVSALSPLKQQVFRWFREKYDGHIHPEKLMPGVYIIRYGTWTSITYNTYEEAESACIDKFIELAKQDNEGL
jgi:hypothetical protein